MDCGSARQANLGCLAGSFPYPEKRAMFQYSLALLAGLLVAVPAGPNNWAEGLFEQSSKDFGAVPRGPVLTYHFRLTNNTAGPVRVSNLRVSCGCTVARMDTPLLAPGESGVVTTEMHTDRFLGDKTVSVYVLFDLPALQEVSLQLKARSCEEVVVTPDTLDFGRVPHGQARKAQTVVSFPGAQQYQIQKVTVDSEHVHVSLSEMPSAEGDGGNKLYQVTASLDAELPVGKWYTEVWLHTNHPWMERLRVPVLAEVEPPLTVIPAQMKLDAPAPGQKVQRKVLVNGNAPFVILAVKGTDARWSVHDDTPGRSLRHILTVTLQNATEEGPSDHCFKVITDLPGESTVLFHAQAEEKP
jgi:Protein of unknown function (DUF1573)